MSLVCCVVVILCGSSQIISGTKHDSDKLISLAEKQGQWDLTVTLLEKGTQSMVSKGVKIEFSTIFKYGIVVIKRNLEQV